MKQEEDALKDDRHAFLQEMRRLKQEHADMAEKLQMFHLQQHVRNEAEQAEAEIEQQRNFII